MEQEHTETVVEKAVAYVKDMFVAPPYQWHVDSEGRPIMPSSEMEKAVERAKNVDGSKEGLSPAELYADGPMS